MRISYLSNSVIPSRSANSLQTMKMAEAFATVGHRVRLYAIGPDENPDEDPFARYGVAKTFELERLRLRRLPAKYFWYGYGVVRRALRTKPDLVYSRSMHAAYFAARTRLPVVFEAHHLIDQADPVSTLMQTRLFRSPPLRRMVTISAMLKNDLVERYPNIGETIVAHDGASALAFGPVAELGPGFHAGYVGHLYPGRGLELIAALSRRLPGIRFHLVGGTQSDINRWREIMGDCANVVFHGYHPHHELGALFRAFDVALAPYQKNVATCRWMSPLKLFDYMAAGLPIIASDLPVIREVLRDGENALLVAPQDTLAWAGALERLAQQPGLGARLGNAAHLEFVHLYQWEGRAKRVLHGIDGT